MSLIMMRYVGWSCKSNRVKIRYYRKSFSVSALQICCFWRLFPGPTNLGIVWAVQIKTLDHVGQHDLLNALGCENADFLAKIRIGESLPALRFLDCVQLPCRELASTFWVAAHEESAEKEQN